jgi:glycerol-1-phosphate dehydrogenase [NAD(P)+]
MLAENPKTIWSLPEIRYTSLSDLSEERPVAILSDTASWDRVGSSISLPVVVQAEPDRTDSEFLDYLAENVPALVEAIYAIGSGQVITIARVVAHKRGLPLVIIPTELDTDQILEGHAELMDNDGILTNVMTGPAERIVIDWDVIQAADPHRRAGVVADMLAIVTGLLDWRYAAKQKRAAPDQQFVPWAAGIAAGLASHTIKIADAIGRGEVEALRTLLDLTSVSVQLANQLGHARQQEGTEHYFAFALEKLGVNATHAECLGPGILLTSALHSQDPSPLRDALEKAGIRLDQLRPADIQVAINDLQGYVLANDLPFSIAHEIEPMSDQWQKALEIAKVMGDTGGWERPGDTSAQAAVAPDTASMPPATGVADTGQAAPTSGGTADAGGISDFEQPPLSDIS